jgi:hypothetical protein
MYAAVTRDEGNDADGPFSSASYFNSLLYSISNHMAKKRD